MNGFLDALKKESGCSLIIMAWGVFAVGYMIYWFASGGNPENKKFFDDCYRQQTRRYAPGDVPDYGMRAAIAECTNRQNERLGLPNTHLRAN